MKMYYLIFVGIFLSFSNCDLFSTRNAERPENRQSNWIPPLSPEQVILNLQNAIYERNADNFMRCLPDTAYSSTVYSFEADPKIAIEFSRIFLNWSLQNEVAVIRQIFSVIPSDNAAFLVFNNEKWVQYDSENAIYAAQYYLELEHTQPGIDSVYQGSLVYNLVPDTRGEWSISKWKDNGERGAESWSRLKAIFGG